MSTAASARQLTLPEFQPKDKRMKPRTTYASVGAYLQDRVPSRRTLQIYDGAEIRRIARFCGLHPSDVRSQLKRCGYEKTTTSNGLVKWVKIEEATSHEA